MPPPSHDPAIALRNSWEQQSLMGTGPDKTVMIWAVPNGALAFTTERVASGRSQDTGNFYLQLLPPSESTMFQWISQMVGQIDGSG